MNLEDKRRMTFPLRLSRNLKDVAIDLAREDGVSLNHFINLAVAEKVSRLESETLMEHQALLRQQRLVLAAGIINKSFYR
jgi:hypothetical protein